MSRLWTLAAQNLRRDAVGALLSAAGVAVGVGSLLFFVSLGLGVSEVIRTRIFPVDATALEVVPPQLSLGKLFGGSQLDEASLSRLRSLPGARAAYPKMALRVPAVSRYQGSFFGSDLAMAIEVVAIGVDAELLGKDVAASAFVDPGPGSPKAIPCVISNRLLEIYNKSFAPARHLPRLSPQMVLGFEFPVELGVSFVSDVGQMPHQGAHLEVVGSSDRALLAGVTLPLAAVRRLNELYHQDAVTYSAVTLEARTADDVPALAQAVRGMGFQIDDTDRSRAEEAGTAVALVTTALGVLSVLIVALAAITIAQTLFASLRARARELAVMRAVGATRGDIALLVVMEASMIGSLGGIAGALGARLSAWGCDRAAARFVPEFPFRPESFFGFPTWLWGLGLALGFLAATVGALVPARAAARLDPAQVLAG